MKLSIRTRLTLAFILVFTALLIIFTGFVYAFLSHSIEQKIHEDSLHDMGVIITNLTEAEWRAEVDEMPDESDEFRLLIKILDPQGRLMKLAGRVDESSWPTDPQFFLRQKAFPVWESYQINDIPHTVLTQAFNPPGQPTHYIQIANSEADKDWILRRFIYYVNIGTLIVLILTVMGGYILSKKALAPVEGIRRRAAAINSESLHERLVYDGPADELSLLTDTLNSLLSRIQRSVNQMRGFIADASHELRIPLSGIRGTLEVGLRQKRSPDEAHEIMDTAYRESERLSELVSELLSLARADAGEMKLEKSEVDIGGFLENVYEEAQALNAEKNVRIALGDIPSGSAIFDEARVHHLMINLIENAIRYNKLNGEIFISAAIVDGKLRMSVKDTGIGISPEDQAKIFDRFYRVDKARSRDAGGTGLGLSIARAIAEAHNGTLEVTSVMGQGSEFILTLPRS